MLEVLALRQLAEGMEQVQLRPLRVSMVVAVDQLVRVLLMLVLRPVLEAEGLVELDFVELVLLGPLLLLLLLRREVLRAAVADELAPAAAVLLLVRHPSGHTQPSGLFDRSTAKTTFKSQLSRYLLINDCFDEI